MLLTTIRRSAGLLSASSQRHCRLRQLGGGHGWPCTVLAPELTPAHPLELAAVHARIHRMSWIRCPVGPKMALVYTPSRLARGSSSPTSQNASKMRSDCERELSTRIVEAKVVSRHRRVPRPRRTGSMGSAQAACGGTQHRQARVTRLVVPVDVVADTTIILGSRGWSRRLRARLDPSTSQTRSGSPPCPLGECGDVAWSPA